ncbi:MAG: hypothetical protein ACOCUH_00705 [Bacteriovoracia bacterium]
MSENTDTTQLETPVKLTPKSFRMSSEVQDFYRFVYDNDMRKEASLILKTILKVKKSRNSKKKLH